MKCTIQYVSQAQVSVNDSVVAAIGTGYVVLAGVCRSDTVDSAIRMAAKIANLRVIPDREHKLNLNLSQVNGEVLLVSQFTLCSDTSSNRPSFSSAAAKDQASRLLDVLKTELTDRFRLSVKTGVFGAHMVINLANNGPITITLEN